MSDAFVIETDALTKTYGRVIAVDELNLSVRPGQITGFLGRNGVGKTTTIKILLGMLRATSGTARLLGREIDDPDENVDARRHVAYVAEEKQLYDYMKVEELIFFTRSFFTDWRPDIEARLLKQFELPADRKVKTLSKGMRTRLALLLALARRPTLLILDEPTDGLDPVSVEEFLQELAVASADGSTVFFSSHQLPEIERVADRICMIDHGSLVTDLSMDDLRRDYRLVTLGFDATPPGTAEFDGEGILHVEASGRQVALLVDRGADAFVERGRSLGAVTFDVAPVTLRDLFLRFTAKEA
jgi:ABC-2 type transport system ATP-binding protein